MMLDIEWDKLLGMDYMKKFKISGCLLVCVDQYVDPVGAKCDHL